MVFSKKIFVADSNEIAVSYCIGCVKFRHRGKFRSWTPFVGVGAKNKQKYDFFWFFVNFF
jgi:hypothetical protein